MNDLLNEENELNLLATDGFRCVREDVESGTQLLVTFQFGNEDRPFAHYRRASSPLFTYSHDTSDVGMSERMRQLLIAVCRYLTAGGSFDDLRSVVRMLQSELGDCRLVVPPDWELLTTFGHDAGWHHIFWKPETGDAVVMVEDALVTQSEVDAISRYLVNDEE